MIIHGDCLEVLREMEASSIDSLVTDPPAGIAFMGNDWDKDRGGRAEWVAWMTQVMRECLRVLKPGAHALVWAIPRTSHWTATALEDAGFEIRDVVTHLFGTGFPKSLDVSKAIDKAAGAEQKVLGVSANARPDSDRGNGLAHGAYGKVWNETAPATDDARRWQGWGTALKPACEHWILVRKPISEKTVAANVLKWGTGALNVDGCRVSHTETLARPPLSTNKHEGYQRPWNSDAQAREAMAARKSESADKAQALGRFPANLVLSHSEGCGETCEEGCAVRALDEQSGTLKSGDLKPGHKQPSSPMFKSQGTIQRTYGGDSGGASRFFYCAKASKSDRGEGNIHPTVKSTKLMSYLCRLVTRPGGTVLDPFAGSGSTGVAALAEGFRFVGIEQDAEYVATAERRVSSVQSMPVGF